MSRPAVSKAESAGVDMTEIRERKASRLPWF